MTTSNFASFTCDQFTDILADFLEREVNEPTRSAMEAHALTCGECGRLLADLRKLRMDAASLPPLEPSRDLWRGVAERIEAPVIAIGTRDSEPGSAGSRDGGLGTRWKRRTWVGLAAACLVAVTATVTHELTKRSVATVQTAALDSVLVKPGEATPPSAPAATIAQPPSARLAQSPNRPAVQSSNRLVSNTKPSVEDTYASEIRRLRVIVNERRGGLDSTTVAVIDKNLKIIDEAIANCRAALRKDPHSRFLTESLNDALDTKVQLLRTAAALPTRM